MEGKAEALARRNTLQELRDLESQAIVNESGRNMILSIGLLICVLGTAVCACGGSIAIAGCALFGLGAMNVLLALYADFGPNAEEVRAAIAFKQKHLTLRRSQ